MNFPNGQEFEDLLSSLRLERPWALVVEEMRIEGSDSIEMPPSDRLAFSLDIYAEEHEISFANGASGERLWPDKWKSASELIVNFTRARPEAIAVSDGVRELNYRELGQQARGLAYRLHEASVSAGDIVVVVLPRSIEFVVSVLALWRLRTAYLSLSPQSPEEWRPVVPVPRFA